MKSFKIVFAIFLLISFLLWICSDAFAWYISGWGRILLIKLLPKWDWYSTYNSKCFIEQHKNNAVTKRVASPDETINENCLLCEHLADIPVLSNVSYSTLESNYLERGIPVIVSDSHMAQNISGLYNSMQQQFKRVGFSTSEPCNLFTNLALRKFFNLKEALQKLQTFPLMDKWFLQMRNCRFNDVKASRLFVRRPYYYPLHFEPFYSSWLLMSHNYVRPMKMIYLNGLIIVQQLSGHFDLRLQPKMPCSQICPNINVRLRAKESMIFSTDLWHFSYGITSMQPNETTIATVLELDWQI